MSGLHRLLGALLAVVLLASCSSGEGSASAVTPGSAIEPIPPGLVPPQLLGLSVAPEDVTEALKEAQRASVDQLALYSLRTQELLVATLQVSRANDPRPATVDRLRDAVLTQLGSSKPREAFLGGRRVYLTTGAKQRLAAWFKGRHMFVLTTREEFPRWRALLREAMEIEP